MAKPPQSPMTDNVGDSYNIAPAQDNIMMIFGVWQDISDNQIIVQSFVQHTMHKIHSVRCSPVWQVSLEASLHAILMYGGFI